MRQAAQVGRLDEAASARQTLADYGKAWRAARRCRPETARVWTSYASHWMEAPIGRLPVRSVRAADVERWVETFGLHMADVSRVSCARTLAGVLKAAAADGLLPDLSGRARIRIEERPAKREPISTDAIRRLWPAWAGSQVGLILRLICVTGMRHEEARGLELDEVIGSACVIALPASRTKTGRARYVPVPATVMRELEAAAQACTARRPQLFDVGPARVRADWHRSLVAVGHPHRRVHDLRHWVVSELDRIGVRPAVASQVVGHALSDRSAITAGYTSAAMTELREAVERLYLHITTNPVPGDHDGDRGPQFAAGQIWRIKETSGTESSS